MPAHVRYRLAALVLLVAVVVVLALVIDVPSVAELRRQYGGTGLLDGVVFALLYAGLSLLPLPASVLTLAAGAVFGVARGSLIVWLGAVVGAVAAFHLGRLLGRDAVTHFTGARLETLDRFLDRRGFVAVLVARLIPVVPYSAFNYLSGLTRLGSGTYAGATAIGIVPGVVVYAALGAYGDRPGSWPFLTALGALAVLFVVGIAVARRRRSESPDESAPDAS